MMKFGFSCQSLELISHLAQPVCLNNIEEEEHYQELLSKIKESLSDFESQVFELMINNFSYIEIAELLEKEPKQIDNTIQRIKTKVKKIIL
mgnify:CR=1 FL=1